MRPYWKAGCSAIYAQEWVTIICQSREFILMEMAYLIWQLGVSLFALNVQGCKGESWMIDTSARAG